MKKKKKKKKKNHIFCIVIPGGAVDEVPRGQCHQPGRAPSSSVPHVGPEAHERRHAQRLLGYALHQHREETLHCPRPKEDQ